MLRALVRPTSDYLRSIANFAANLSGQIVKTIGRAIAFLLRLQKHSRVIEKLG